MSVRRLGTEQLIPYAPLAALILLAVYPILSGGLPTTGDGLNHFYRFAELNWHISQGDFYPRWFTNLNWGYGAPLFNFYGPLSYYIPLIFRIVGLSLETSLQLAYVLALAVAIMGAYAWGRHLFGEQTAPFVPLLVAAAYGLAPYFYLNIFHRGAYPETWALAFAPWLFWGAHKLATLPEARRGFFAFAGFLSAIILTHTLSALVLLPIVAVYFLIVVVSHQAFPRKDRFRAPLISFTLAVLLSLGLTAFFTLPVLFESQFIQLSRTYSTGDLDYHRNFLDFVTLLSAPANYDPLLVFNRIPPSLGWLQVLLAVVAVLLAVRNRGARNYIWLFALLTVVVCLLPLSFTEPLWNFFPFSRYIQFPWRLVGPASLLVAGLAGYIFVEVSDSYKGNLRDSSPKNTAQNDKIEYAPLIAFIVTIGSFFFFSLSWTYHADFSANAPVYQTPADTIRYEIENGQLGTSSTGEYLPRDVNQLPSTDAALSQFTDRATPSRLVTPPTDVTFSTTRQSPTSESVTYTTPEPLTLTYNLYYFPGWVATLDNQLIDIKVSAPNGLITVAVPAGTHTLNLYRQLTLPQWAGIAISFLALLYGIWEFRRRLTLCELGVAGLGVKESAVVALVVVALLVSRPLYFDRTETIFHHTNPIPNAISVNFDNQLELIGYDISPQLVSGEELSLTLYWRAHQPLTNDYSVSVQLADSLGNRFGQSDSQHPNSVPTSRWQLGQYARDTHSVLSLTGTPPGSYNLLVTVYGDNPLSILQEGSPIGVEYALGTVQVTAPPAQDSGPLALSSAELAIDTVSVGDSLAFTALWFTGNALLPPLNAMVELKDDSGKVIYSETRSPAGPDYPTNKWALNTSVRYPLSITLPATLEGGTATVWLSLVDVDGTVTAGPYNIGSVQIIVPDRSFEIPPVQVRVDHDFNGAIRLLGYDLSDEAITLYWQALEPLPTRLTVFVHALNDDGTFTVGHDAQPTRSTTSWLPGEVITDIHPIVITDRFEVGLYEPMSGIRFGETFVTRR